MEPGPLIVAFWLAMMLSPPALAKTTAEAALSCTIPLVPSRYTAVSALLPERVSTLVVAILRLSPLGPLSMSPRTVIAPAPRRRTVLVPLLLAAGTKTDPSVRSCSGASLWKV
ncbi:MAG: hypothetical protein BWX70_02239 [Verrucomicrobia bacterium ADurb.Bin070]|nr:MAG: hypothetical protein BWX70_02239 [Verrucomicrobia bacterium ADurb.Bin070]